MLNNLQLTSQNPALIGAFPTGVLVVFDSRVQDLDLLYQALLPGSFAERGLCPIGFTIRPQADGLETITDLLAATGAKYLAIVAHGEPGVVHLGNNSISIAQIQAQSHRLQSWGVDSIDLYSCEVAQGSIGQDFIYQLSELTGATVAAAATKVGSAALGGNWDLTATTGAITAPKLFASEILDTYQAVLAVSFGAATNLPVGASPRSVTVGDFNGDRKLDLATANYNDNNISIILGNGDGSFRSANNFPVGTNPTSIAVGDFNGDKKLDLVATNSGANTISVLLGNGDGSFEIATNFEVGNTPYSVTVGKFNGDSNLDLAVANYGGNTVSVLLGNGTDGFGAATNFGVGSNPESITVGDFDGDKKLDLVTANERNKNVSLLLGNGTGGFATTNFAVGDTPDSVTVGDFNGDKKLDLAVTNYNSYNNDGISVLLGNETGGFTATNFATGSSPLGITAGDFNSDGKLDLATTSFTDYNVSVLLGNGTGGFGAANNFAVGTSPRSVIIGDFNGDLKLDLATANSYDNNVSVLLNTTVNAVRNDFNGDGKSDILWRSDFGSIALWQMDGDIITTPNLTSSSSRELSWKVAGTGDFNGDGKSEVLWHNNSSGEVNIWTMDGYRVIGVAQTSTAVLDPKWQTVGTGDFNGDGKTDILWRNTNLNDNRVVLWTMDGANVVESKLTSTPTLDKSWKAAGTGDFNGDGKSDILWRNDDGSIALWQMNGTNVSSKLTSTPSLDNSWKINGTADFNGDGKTDVLWRKNSGEIVIWTMDGTNVSSQRTSTPSVDNSWQIKGTGDFNGDGKADILWRKDEGIADPTTDIVAIWTMDGTKILSSTLTSIQPESKAWKVAAPIF
jgi:hypothetical protein